MSKTYIKSPMNYTGGKYRILEHIIPTFPKHVNKFVDLFVGGFEVGINTNADIIYANDQITFLVELYSYLQEINTIDLIDMVKARINEYNLSLTNTDGYNRLRVDYNAKPSPLNLFILICYSFNHQIRFNSKHEFNTPFGKGRSIYNTSIENNLIRFCKALQRKKIIFSTEDFRNFNFSTLNTGDLIYCDPPYLITTGSYNDGKRGFKDWAPEEETALLNILDELNSRGVLFALSNVFIHKGLTNDILIAWSKKYNINYIDKTYSNCSYHFKDRKTKTIEILITNYV